MHDCYQSIIVPPLLKYGDGVTGMLLCLGFDALVWLMLDAHQSY